MVLVSYSGKEINAKIVFYGPGLCGKTTNLEYIYGSIPSTSRGKMVSMKTKTERTLFFDFLPLNLGELAGFKTRFLLYTVPGQVYYNATRKLVLKGVDAVIFVADSQRGKMDENVESLQNLEQNLAEHGLSLDAIPYVIQYNKRDLPDVHTVDELEHVLNKAGVPSFEAVATTGDGVFETFKACSKLLLARLSKEIGAAVVKSGGPAPSAATVARAAASGDQGQKRPASEPAAAELSLDELASARPLQPADPANADRPPQLERPAPAAASAEAADGPAGSVGDQRKSRGLWRWLRKDEPEIAAESPLSRPKAEPEITWRPARQPEPVRREEVAGARPRPAESAPNQPLPSRPSATPPRLPVAPLRAAAPMRPATSQDRVSRAERPAGPVVPPPVPPPVINVGESEDEVIQGGGFFTAEPAEPSPETIEIDTRDQLQPRDEDRPWLSDALEREDAPARAQSDAPASAEGEETEVTGIPGLERSPFAGMAHARPRPAKPAAQQSISQQFDPPQQAARPPAPERPPEQAAAVEPAAHQAAAPKAPSREMLRPFVAGPAGVEEIVVPVIIPRTAIRDRVEIRLVLRIVQELDVPSPDADSHEGPDGLAASA